ncbi:MAG: class I SAM-dependent methyltransferase [Oscillospiraceae bacterium]|nr:class I SAM-dependent methyltransferase [Oscillospiraceae bacterium]
MMNNRKSVYDLLLRMEKGAYSKIILDIESKKYENLPQDKKFIAALFYGVIERQLTLDYIIGKLSELNPDPPTRILLRMALYQILFMNSVPDSAAVNQSVELAQKRSKGYVNAVLRNFLRQNAEKDFLTEINASDDLSVKYSCPDWLIDKWQSEYGEESTLQILRTSLLKPPTFEKDGIVQDLSSRQACELLDPQPGETILDVCAAPGGKSFTIAKMMKNTGRVVSCDINRKKLSLLEKKAKQMELFTIEAKANDAKVYNPKLLEINNPDLISLIEPRILDHTKMQEFYADRVLCDVPCSGLGVIRRKPEIKYKNPADFEGLPTVQSQILWTSAKYVKQGGVLMYSTCTLSRRENDEVVDGFVEKSPDFTLMTKKTVIPSEDGGDGFFTAVLTRGTR